MYSLLFYQIKPSDAMELFKYVSDPAAGLNLHFASKIGPIYLSYYAPPRTLTDWAVPSQWLQRLCELYQIPALLDAVPVLGDWTAGPYTAPSAELAGADHPAPRIVLPPPRATRPTRQSVGKVQDHLFELEMQSHASGAVQIRRRPRRHSAPEQPVSAMRKQVQFSHANAPKEAASNPPASEVAQHKAAAADEPQTMPLQAVRRARIRRGRSKSLCSPAAGMAQATARRLVDPLESADSRCGDAKKRLSLRSQLLSGEKSSASPSIGAKRTAKARQRPHSPRQQAAEAKPSTAVGHLARLDSLRRRILHTEQELVQAETKLRRSRRRERELRASAVPYREQCQMRCNSCWRRGRRVVAGAGRCCSGATRRLQAQVGLAREPQQSPCTNRFACTDHCLWWVLGIFVASRPTTATGLLQTRGAAGRGGSASHIAWLQSNGGGRVIAGGKCTVWLLVLVFR